MRSFPHARPAASLVVVTSLLAFAASCSPADVVKSTSGQLKGTSNSGPVPKLPTGRGVPITAGGRAFDLAFSETIGPFVLASETGDNDMYGPYGLHVSSVATADVALTNRNGKDFTGSIEVVHWRVFDTGMGQPCDEQLRMVGGSRATAVAGRYCAIRTMGVWTADGETVHTIAPGEKLALGETAANGGWDRYPVVANIGSSASEQVLENARKPLYEIITIKVFEQSSGEQRQVAVKGDNVCSSALKVRTSAGDDEPLADALAVGSVEPPADWCKQLAG